MYIGKREGISLHRRMVGFGEDQSMALYDDLGGTCRRAHLGVGQTHD